MKFLRNKMDQAHHHFAKGGKFERFYAIYEMVDTFLFTPGEVTKGKTHVRDGLDLKRLMFSVIIALTPTLLFAIYNTGLQTNLYLAGATPEGWRGSLMTSFGFGFDANSCADNFMHGLLYWLPIFLVTNIVGGFWEALFAMVRGHEINEGFLVTGMLFPLIVPASIPLWQVALGISFGVVFGKEVFGGTGRNFLNPALVGRAFLFFAYPAQISGDAVWVPVDGYSAATPLSVAAAGGMDSLSKTFEFSSVFLGTIPGSMGETSTLLILLGAVILIAMRVASWRIMASILLGAGTLVFIFNELGSATNPMFGVSPLWHLAMGGFAFGMVFMATDPVSASMTRTGQWYYGFLIGVMVILVRVVNPAFPEGMMLAILFGNSMAPLIDHYVLKANVKRRALRHA